MSGVRIRITGTREETAATIDALAGVIELREVSGFYPNRDSSLLGRVYLDAEPRTAPVRVTAERLDQPGSLPRREGGRQ